MATSRPPQDEHHELRRKAEAALGRMIANTVPSLEPENVEALVHELRVHQIELQLQCDELRRSRQEAEDSRDRYCDLYESVPATYLTLDPHGKIEQINAAGERLLSADRDVLKGRPLQPVCGGRGCAGLDYLLPGGRAVE